MDYGNKPPKGPATVVRVNGNIANQSILTGINSDAFEVKSHLYKNKKISKNVKVLLTGTLKERDNINEPVAWTNTVNDSRVFYTSLGSTSDFDLPNFKRLLLNGVLWALDKPIPPADPRVIAHN